MKAFASKDITMRHHLQPLWAKLICRWANQITIGELTILFPNGAAHIARGTIAGPSATLEIKSSKLVWKLVTGGDLGFGRSYLDGDWDSPDLGALLAVGIANEKALSGVLNIPFVARSLAFLRHRFRANTKAGSRRNIAFHYDLGNEFYSHWLDETMTYSSALYSHPDQSLADAQNAKYDRIIQALNIDADDHVLEIGCGWGGFAEYAVRVTGCKLTCLTLSREQASYAIQRLNAAGFAEHVDVRIEDYRDCTGTFDKIVSIEMFEAVGEENWSVYFSSLRKQLKAGGSAMVQVITIDEAYFSSYRKNADFIQTYIFPGGMLPSPTAFIAAASAERMVTRDEFHFAKDYSRTLMAWDKAFVEAWPQIAPLGFDDRFKRMWRYYLYYCAAGFDSGRISVAQFVLGRD
jgi:cyclopropane-fatty-acyl-phospholipid synthase